MIDDEVERRDGLTDPEADVARRRLRHHLRREPQRDNYAGWYESDYSGLAPARRRDDGDSHRPLGAQHRRPVLSGRSG
jgi:hypothetical protein